LLAGRPVTSGTAARLFRARTQKEPTTVIADDNSTHLVLTGPICRAAVPDLCAHAGSVLERAAGQPVTCDVGGLGQPDFVAVDVLARLHLKARHYRSRLLLCNASHELSELLALAGLDHVLLRPSATSLRLGRQAEQREELGVDEDVDGADPSV
jgi:ABC-type transporter Mla MlaB component